MMSRIKAFLIITIVLCCGIAGSAVVSTRITNPEKSSGQPDGITLGGDRENSYAWCMDVLPQPDGDYLYVGSNRNLIYSMLRAYLVMVAGYPLEQANAIIGQIFKGDIGIATNSQGRVFRYKVDGSAGWEEVYRASNAYRGAVTYTDSEGKTALYMVTSAAVPGKVLKFASDFDPAQDVPDVVMRLNQVDMLGEGPLRAIAKHGDSLIVGSFTNSIYITDLPVKQPDGDDTSLTGWTQIASPQNFGSNNILWQVLSFNGSIYAFLAGGPVGKGAFSVYKGTENKGEWNWQPIVGDVAAGAKYPFGMGDLYNSATSTTVYKGHVYVGSMTEVHLSFLTGQFDPSGIKGGQLYRFDENDNWELVIGDLDRNPLFEERLGNYGAGFFNQSIRQRLLLQGTPLEGRNFSFNQYIWWMEEHKGKLYLTTFDFRVFLKYVSPELLTAIGLNQNEIDNLIGLLERLETVLENDAGFDIYVSSDGINWDPVTTDGFADPYNYGGRVLKSTDEGLFVGTANPFWGCQVWLLNETSGGSGSNCFIATAAFGSPMARQVDLLRNFRDSYLLTNGPGRLFVKYYYSKSPSVARIIESNEMLRFTVRLLLYPVILFAWLIMKGILLPLLAIMLSFGLIAGKKKVACRKA